jgi:hypothetical protein
MRGYAEGICTHAGTHLIHHSLKHRIKAGMHGMLMKQSNNECCVRGSCNAWLRASVVRGESTDMVHAALGPRTSSSNRLCRHKLIRVCCSQQGHNVGFNMQDMQHNTSQQPSDGDA